jgi:acyl-CoA dehydrogenase
MDLSWSAEDEAFRDEVRAFLSAELTPELKRGASLTTSVFTDKDVSLPWQKKLHARGWVAPSWPVEYGGTGWTDTQRYIWRTECALAGAPGLAPMGLGMVGPVIMKYGTPEQKAFYLPRILSGEDYWCQGYSEPQAGSDLAALDLKATSDGEDYILNGSKIWTTHAHWANRMFALVRTSSTGKKQEGITFVLLEMESPGITVSPIVTLAGDHEVNQVFFDNVRVPKSGRLGEENSGWTVAKALLEFERGGGGAGGLKVAVARLKALAESEQSGRGGPVIDDRMFRRRLADLETRVTAIEMTEHRVLSAFAAGTSPGAVSSILKVQSTETMQLLDELCVEAAGHYSAVHQPGARTVNANAEVIGPQHTLTVMPRYLNDRAASIYGGSNEIQRNIAGRLILGL